MNWEALGAIGEIVGAIAVVVTLVYLATQIRQNTKAVQAASVDSSISAINATRQSVYEDPELMVLWTNGLADPDQLDSKSRDKFRFIMHNVMFSQWNFYSQSRFAGLSTTWEPQKQQLKRLLCQPGGKWFLENFQQEFDAGFLEEIDRILNADDS